MQQDKRRPSAACHLQFYCQIQFPLIVGRATLEMETVIHQAEFESFIIALY